MLRIVLLLVGLATADNVTIWGAGVSSCGKVLQNRVEYNGQMILDWPTGQWVLGYISAVVALAPAADPLLSTLDSDAITVFITKHCEENPLESLKDATRALVSAKMRQEAKKAGTK